MTKHDKTVRGQNGALSGHRWPNHLGTTFWEHSPPKCGFNLENCPIYPNLGKPEVLGNTRSIERHPGIFQGLVALGSIIPRITKQLWHTYDGSIENKFSAPMLTCCCLDQHWRTNPWAAPLPVRRPQSPPSVRHQPISAWPLPEPAKPWNMAICHEFFRRRGCFSMVFLSETLDCLPLDWFPARFIICLCMICQCLPCNVIEFCILRS